MKEFSFLQTTESSAFLARACLFFKKKVVRCRNVYNLQCIHYTTPEHNTFHS